MSSWVKETYGKKHQFHIKDYYLNKRAKYLNDKLNINLMKGKNVLDIAIGSNWYIYSLNFENKYAIELDDNFIKEHKNNGINVFSYDLNEGLPENILSNKYELIFALEIGEHLLNGNKFFQSISNCLTDTGVLIVSLPNDMGFYLNRIETFYRGHPYGKNKTNIYENNILGFFH